MYEFSDSSVSEALADEWTIDRLLAGRLAPGDAPRCLAGIAVLVRALGAPARPGELVGIEEILTAVDAALDEALEEARRQDGRRHRYRFGVAAAVSTLGLLAVSSGLAAAHVLPDPAQRVASDVLAHVGVEVESPAPPATTGKGPTISGIAHEGTSGPGTGAAVSDAASNGRSRAGTPPGPPVSAPPASTPPASGTLPTTADHPGLPSTAAPAGPPATRPAPPTPPGTGRGRQP